MRFVTMLRLLTLTTLGVLAITPSASAYIDPTAAGSMIQSLYIVGVSLFMGLALAPRRLMGWVATKLGRKTAEESDQKPDAP